MNSVITILWRCALLPSLAVAVACTARDAELKGAVPVDSSSGVVSKPATPPARAVAADSDTATPVLITGRKKHDSVAFASAVAFGRRQSARWPTPPTPLPGSILPAKRVVAFYGNPLSKRMGVLGEYAPDTMLAKLDSITREWERADPSTPVQPALAETACIARGWIRL